MAELHHKCFPFVPTNNMLCATMLHQNKDFKKWPCATPKALTHQEMWKEACLIVRSTSESQCHGNSDCGMHNSAIGAQNGTQKTILSPLYYTRGHYTHAGGRIRSVGSDFSKLTLKHTLVIGIGGGTEAR
jgi:hypothetical protein